ncbi:MAG: MarR family winged helix-turn-helix transcriptional regulator [Bacillota bacterium]
MESFFKNKAYQVLLDIMKLHFHRSHNLLDKVDIYPGQPPLMMVLNEQDGQSQSELAEKLKIKPATITVMINRMEKVDLLERRRDAEDQRVSRVYLTDKGREKVKVVMDILEKISTECLKGFDEQEGESLYEFLLRIKSNLS